MTKAFVLRKFVNESGLHPSDILVEVGQATLASGTVEVPTGFANGTILGVLAMKNGTASIANDGTGAVALTSDCVVTSGAVTISTTVNTYAGTIFYAIFARPTV